MSAFGPNARIRIGLLALIAVCIYAWIWHAGQRDLHRQGQSDNWFAERYNAKTPLFLTPDNDQSVLSDLANDAQRQAVSVLLQDQDKAVTQLEKKRLSQHPLSCAVVGNAPNLIGSGYGKLIDGHALVFRMNNAPIKKFEADVGARTSYHIIHSYFTHINHFQNSTVTILIFNNIDTPYRQKKIHRGEVGFDDYYVQDLAWLSAQLSPEAYGPDNAPEKPKVFPTNITEFAGSLRLLHPDFVYYISDRWFTPDNRWKLDLPSTGFKTIILALHMCDSIDLFGFSSANDKQEWSHYYSPDFYRKAKAHRPGYQEEFIAELEKRGFVRRFPGKTPVESAAPHNE